MLTLLLPGGRVGYYGEEIGMQDNTDISFAQTKDALALSVGEVRLYILRNNYIFFILYMFLIILYLTECLWYY